MYVKLCRGYRRDITDKVTIIKFNSIVTNKQTNKQERKKKDQQGHNYQFNIIVTNKQKDKQQTTNKQTNKQTRKKERKNRILGLRDRFK
jgi:hypothetical protein